MALHTTWAVALFGVDGVLVEIESDVRSGGIPSVQLLGLPDAALQESKNRVRAAIRNSGEHWPQSCITLALSPAAMPKTGTSFDTALAMAVLAGAERVPPGRLDGTVFFGELALDGRIRPVRGLVPGLLAAVAGGMRRAVVPLEGMREAALVERIEILGAETLREVIDWTRGTGELWSAPDQADEVVPRSTPTSDLVDVLGQPEARWALEIAAAGGHHLLMVGPPGTGKTMLAGRLSGLLPELSVPQALETTAVHSVAGELSENATLLRTPPFVAPHHSISVPGLIGGGTGLARPGAVSRAHHGVLFLDEACEWGTKRLESMRTALEEGEIRLARSDGTLRYPARFQLVMATNPCPCAPARDIDCQCTPHARRKYFGRLSGPLLDRIDLRVRMRPMSTMELPDAEPPEPSSAVRERVSRAHRAALLRWERQGWRSNSEVPGPVLRREFPLPDRATRLLDKGLDTGALTARGADRCLRVAWTLSDLDGAERPDADHVAAALQFRDRATA
ncbi:YifB family Mg chelatase-like AAA ATPase [Actinopolyspora sp. H202]|uniref:YifB family Mg chelatase-like AAA ATPase n=1 Tax=Actinopolyspora sp. H202 TaxID=1500456 RepID=UPI003EE694EB